MVTLIIPAYNEEQRIGKTLQRYLKTLPHDVRLLVCLNGCTDRTEDVVRAFQERHPDRIEMQVITTPGKGIALRTGFRLASESLSDLIGFVDADGATSPEELIKMIAGIGIYDGIIASRWMSGSVVNNRSVVRTLVSKGFGLAQRIIVGLPFADTQCGAKIFRKSAVQRIWPKMHVDNMAVDVELLMLMQRESLKIVEVPTVWDDQEQSAQLGSPWKLIRQSIAILFTLCAIKFRHYPSHV